MDPRKVVHNGLANGEGLQGRVRIGGRGEGEGGGGGESEGEGEGWEVMASGEGSVVPTAKACSGSPGPMASPPARARHLASKRGQ